MALDIANLTDVSNRISKNTSFLQTFLDSRKLPVPSYNIDTPKEFPNPDKERTVQLVRESILADTRALFDLVLGPVEKLQWTVWQVSSLEIS